MARSPAARFRDKVMDGLARVVNASTNQEIVTIARVVDAKGAPGVHVVDAPLTSSESPFRSQRTQLASFYTPLFAAAFGTPEITRDRVAAALAQFLQSLISYQSKSDLANNPMTNVHRYLRQS
jgi:predicted nuclease with RNAse H fold